MLLNFIILNGILIGLDKIVDFNIGRPAVQCEGKVRKLEGVDRRCCADFNTEFLAPFVFI